MSVPAELGARLLPWLKANAEEMARDLRDAGWEEDELGLWRRRGHRGAFRLFSAHEIVRSEQLQSATHDNVAGGFMAERVLTATEKQMGEVLNNHYMAPELKVERLLRIVEALVNENLAPAMSRARAEALEEASEVVGAEFRRLDAAFGSPCDRRSGILDMHGSAQAALNLLAHGKVATPAPASIPVERVREVLLAYYSGAPLAYRRDLLDCIAERLSVDLDAKREAKDTRQTCTCTGSCKGAAGLGAGWRCALERKP